MEYIFSFSSRNGAMRFRDDVTCRGVYARLVNTPTLFGSGCGLSVKCTDYATCSDVLSRGYYQGLRAVYEFDGSSYRSLYSAGNQNDR